MASKKILVVDDEAAIRDFLENALGKAGYSVRTAANSDEALEVLGQEHIPVMFIDLDIGAINGFELCEQIRKNNPRVIIYALSGYAKLFEPHVFRKAGFDDYFAKPINMKSIYQALRDSFENINRHKVIERILIIDDDDQFRKMLRNVLELEDYMVMEASDGEEGIRCQSRQPADLIIIDIIMPGKDGLDTMFDIMDAFPEVKFILVSGGIGYEPETKLEIAQKLGAQILKKPFKGKTILKVIEQLQN